MKQFYKLELGAEHREVGRTLHSNGATVLPRAQTLVVAGFEESGEYYLLHFDETGKELTDTFHESIEEAFQQAEFEFDIKPHEWTKL